METIMGQDVNSLLRITNDLRTGRITFFVAICILPLCYALYNIAVIIWSSKKEETLIELRQELYKVFKKKGTKAKEPVKSTKNKGIEKSHALTNRENMEVRPKSSNPTGEDIEKAIESIEYFHRKKHL